MSKSLSNSQRTDAKLDLARHIEHTILGENISKEQIEKLLQEAINLQVFGVCVPAIFVPFCKQQLKDKNISVVTVVDFPLGQNDPHEKAKETAFARSFGADEIDMVLDYQALIKGNYKKVLHGIQAVVDAALDKAVKVIVETSALNQNQLAIACALVALSGAKFIKTSTGFHEAGAKVEDIKTMRELLPESVLIKASGGIRDRESALAMINAGAERIGTSGAKNILLGK